MASAAVTAIPTFSPIRASRRNPSSNLHCSISSPPPPQQSPFKPKLPSSSSRPVKLSNTLHRLSPQISISTTKSSDKYLEDLIIESKDNHPQRPIGFVFSVLVWTCLSLAFSAIFVGKSKALAAAAAASDSIRASGFGLKVASSLRSLGWADEAVVFALATLPVVELRGAIPVGYWLQLNPFLLTILSVLGNMVPVPFIVLYLKRLSTFLAGSSPSASHFLNALFEKARKKAEPVIEFQWLGLMLFVAVPFPGTGAWTGAIIASILDMPFWSAVSANFFGVVVAALLVNFLVNLGLKYAIVAGFVLFFVSTFMWTALRNLKKSLGSSN